MNQLKNVWNKVVYFVGVVIPTITFFIIFVTFTIGILSRYVLRQPVPWTYEVSILAYMWTMFFGVGYAMKLDEHVVFGLVYDSVNDTVKKIFRVTYNILIIIAISVAFVPCMQSMLSKQGITGVLELPYKWVFAPFFLMFADILIRCIYSVIREFIPNKKEEVN